MQEKLEPQAVFHYFEEICRIPHGSGNTKQISDYLKQFAIERGLYCRQDEWNNIVIIKEASKGYEDHEPVILQGHMDMVAVKDADCPLDLQRDGLKLRIEGDRMFAEGTSLGGDDGIAIAMALAVLDSEEYLHPRIEFVATVDEEVGMEGAMALSAEDLTAKRMINLDQEEEKVFIAGCAGGARVDIRKTMLPEKQEGELCKLEIKGLQGGHSGQEINKERGNAICLMGRILAALQEQKVIYVKELQGGVADNAIPSECRAVLVIKERSAGQCVAEGQTGGVLSTEGQSVGGTTSEKPAEAAEIALRTLTEHLLKDLREELRGKEDGFSWTLGIGDTDIVSGQNGAYEVCGQRESEQWIRLLNVIPYGVIANSVKMEGLVETSLNPGILKVSATQGILSTSVRSSVAASKEALIGRLKSLAALAEATVAVRGDYPGWDYDPDSQLRRKMVSLYQEMYGETPAVEAIHAGLECGIFISKLPGLDCVSIGPDMSDIHTTRETLSIASVERVFAYLLRLLAEL